jgi:peroxiredoxin Q/BCP
LALVAVGIAAWLILRSGSEPVSSPGALPGPRGGPSVAVDVNTLVGQTAPAFTLTDSEGTSYAVTPGRGRPLVLVFHMGITWQLCVEQLGELQQSVEQLRQQADVYVVNSDTPDKSRQLKQTTGITLPVLLDPQLGVARIYDMLPKPGQPMGDMSGVAQMGFVIVDASGTIRLQRVDIHFGQDADQMLEILRLIEAGATPTAGTRSA